MNRPLSRSCIDVCQYRWVPNSLGLLSPVQTVACCSPLSRDPLSQDQAEQIAPLLKALADPVRLRLLSIVASHAGGEACVCDLTDCFALSQPTISHHLKVLHEAGLLDREKRGTWVYYRARSAALTDLAALITPAEESAPSARSCG
jgi:ArsR family transcriptional regulator